MISALLLAAAVMVAPPSPPPIPVSVGTPASVVVEISPAPVNPCAHRVFCGPVRLLPRDPAERRAFLLRVALQTADGLVTAAGVRISHLRSDDLFTVARSRCAANPLCVAAPGAVAFNASHGVAQPFVARAYEADPLVAPFAHGGLGMLLVGGVVGNAATAYLQRRWTPARRAAFDRDAAATHVLGIATWVPVFAARRAWEAGYNACAARVLPWFNPGDAAAGNPPSTMLAGPADANPQGYALQSVPDVACSKYSGLPVTMHVVLNGAK